ncbi:3-oxo-isoapionate kinase OiaK [Xanthobacter aminoxidans]|uniref:3-oxo-isoapionate kinase OiaK n=1 Tax=Xanthobacter aminoxidans TaxID=186280 RepID=UPI00202306A3|nr:3-oxo-isoapionate kinase OiaK [Xanthobacter aminoxidans]MCL8384589.1 four-carbon acid sugar kinase family protein [Xanthobacter aminoxidans]
MTSGTKTGAALPEGLLLAYYGDDFTGSTDALEAITAAGVPSVLFLRPPTEEMRARFPHARAIGLAGSSRGRSPEWMDKELPPLFARLAALGAPVLHYKVCSTFDSAPHVGSIGRAIDLGVRQMGGGWSPMVVGVPRLGRYQMFGNLFVTWNGTTYRLDRHPTMSRHPVTPMDEADLGRHLARQTDRRMALIDLAEIRAGKAQARCDALRGDDTPVVLIDVMDEATLVEAGRLIWENRGDGLFSASSSGLQYALAAYWRSLGLLPETPGLPKAAAVEKIAVVSGSCSPVTAAQLAHARTAGFHTERLDLSHALSDVHREAEVARAVATAMDALSRGLSPVVYSAEGPDDAAVAGFDATAAAAGLSRADAARRVGTVLAEIMRRIVESGAVRRVMVAGGDSSGEVMEALNIFALDIVAGLAPGAPLCRAWSDDPLYDGLELVLKGGQMGPTDFFPQVRG